MSMRDRDRRRPRLQIVFEDDDVLVIDKPPGLLTSTVPHEKRPTALAMVREYLAELRTGLIHRLDRDASGLLVFSKNPGAYHSLKEQFFRHSVDRIYHAVVDGAPKQSSGRIRSQLIEAHDGKVRSAERGAKGEQEALTEFQVIRISRDAKRALLRVKPHTGRKHQIRAHLSERGMPIVNDPIYGLSKRTGMMMLAATELAFDQPRTTKRIKLNIPLPSEMAALMR